MESKYTKGPWTNDRGLIETTGDRKTIAVVNRGLNARDLGDFEGNTKLIAAAPELLEVLKELQNWHIKYPTGKTYSYDMIATVEGELTAIVHKAEAAILKATSI